MDDRIGRARRLLHHMSMNRAPQEARMRRAGILAVIFVVGISAACGRSDEQIAAEKAAEDAKEAAAAVQKAAESAAAAGAAAGAAGAAAGLEALAKGMEGVAGALAGKGPDGKPVQPVTFQSLQSVLPEISGWKREQPTGERMTVPVPFSQAEVQYSKGDAEVEVKIVDSAYSSLLVAPWAMFLTAGYEKQTSSGYEKSVSVGGNPGFERWDSDRKDGELNLVVAKRFLVTIEGNGIADTNVLQDFASKIDAAKLTSLK
jgi:hypothetical protein